MPINFPSDGSNLLEVMQKAMKQNNPLLTPAPVVLPSTLHALAVAQGVIAADDKNWVANKMLPID